MSIDFDKRVENVNSTTKEHQTLKYDISLAKNYQDLVLEIFTVMRHRLVINFKLDFIFL